MQVQAETMSRYFRMWPICLAAAVYEVALLILTAMCEGLFLSLFTQEPAEEKSVLQVDDDCSEFQEHDCTSPYSSFPSAKGDNDAQPSPKTTLPEDLVPKHVVQRILAGYEPRKEQAPGPTRTPSIALSLTDSSNSRTTSDTPSLTDSTATRSHKGVAVLFSDIVGLTSISHRVSPQAKVKLLHDLFVTFDHINTMNDTYKVETLGDGYMVAVGLNNDCDSSVSSADVVNLVRVARKMHLAASMIKVPGLEQPVQLRIGIHCGPLCSGVVGSSRERRYCLFGDTVNVANSMESTALPGRIQISKQTFEVMVTHPEFAADDFMNGFVPRSRTTNDGIGEELNYISKDTCREHYDDATEFETSMQTSGGTILQGDMQGDTFDGRLSSEVDIERSSCSFPSSSVPSSSWPSSNQCSGDFKQCSGAFKQYADHYLYRRETDSQMNYF